MSIVMNHIHNIREKIEDDPAQPAYIEMVWGVGYRFRGEIREQQKAIRTKSVFIVFFAFHDTTMSQVGGIISAKGRVRWPNTQMPSLLEQLCI